MRDVNIGVIGLGNVGGGTLEILTNSADEIARKLGFRLVVKAVCSRSVASKTLPAAANDFITGYAINWGPVFASGVLIVLPVALAALLLQRYIVRGLTLGAFK